MIPTKVAADPFEDVVEAAVAVVVAMAVAVRELGTMDMETMRIRQALNRTRYGQPLSV